MEEIYKVFLLEDDLSFGAVLKAYLEMNNFEVEWVCDGAIAMGKFKNGNYQLCILDVMLPNVDGFTIGKEIRSIDTNIPIIFLTAKTQKPDIIEGFKSGADDYITKPFDSDLLLLKIKAILKRKAIAENKITENNIIQIGKYSFNFNLRTLHLDKKPQSLSPKEASLLKLLILHKNRLLPREVALKTIWGNENYFTARSMDVYITKLRKYLKDDPALEIINIHGSGYKLNIKE